VSCGPQRIESKVSRAALKNEENKLGSPKLKNTVKSSQSFWGSTRAKEIRKLLMKLTPGGIIVTNGDHSLMNLVNSMP